MSVIIGPYPTRYTEGKWRGPTVLQVHATAESAGWKEARVELGYASMSPTNYCTTLHQASSHCCQERLNAVSGGGALWWGRADEHPATPTTARHKEN